MGKRAINEPSTEAVVRGPREGFTETLPINTSMLRRKIKSPAMKMIAYTIGTHTQRYVFFLYNALITIPLYRYSNFPSRNGSDFVVA